MRSRTTWALMTEMSSTKRNHALGGEAKLASARCSGFSIKRLATTGETGDHYGEFEYEFVVLILEAETCCYQTDAEQLQSCVGLDAKFSRKVRVFLENREVR